MEEGDEAGNYEKPDMFGWRTMEEGLPRGKSCKEKRKAFCGILKNFVTPKKPLDQRGEMKSDLHYKKVIWANDLHDGRECKGFRWLSGKEIHLPM